MDSNGVVEAEDSDHDYIDGNVNDTELMVEDEDLTTFRHKRKRKATCETCSISFSKKDNLSCHIRNKHA